MQRLCVAIDIAAKPAEVWRVVEAIEDHVSWMHDESRSGFKLINIGASATAFLVTRGGSVKPSIAWRSPNGRQPRRSVSGISAW